ncbi:hypothetical protein KCP78_08070 [Salmonella enterica subsp. enterica]|nr:hypothetical protein KCP78_08070 [Salmonella enterica subsp. enterica]
MNNLSADTPGYQQCRTGIAVEYDQTRHDIRIGFNDHRRISRRKSSFSYSNFQGCGKAGLHACSSCAPGRWVKADRSVSSFDSAVRRLGMRNMVGGFLPPVGWIPGPDTALTSSGFGDITGGVLILLPVPEGCDSWRPSYSMLVCAARSVFGAVATIFLRRIFHIMPGIAVTRRLPHPLRLSGVPSRRTISGAGRWNIHLSPSAVRGGAGAPVGEVSGIRRAGFLAPGRIRDR